MWYSTETNTAQIGYTTMFSLLTITDIAGNAIVCLLIIKFKDMRLVPYAFCLFIAYLND